MSGESAMAARYEEDVDESASARSRVLMRLSGEFARTLIGCAAGVIGGAKPVALFSFAPSERCRPAAGDGHGASAADLDDGLEGALREVLCAYGRGASALGLHVEAVGRIRGRVMLIAWRGLSVHAVLADPEKRGMLAAAGFGTASVRALMSDVRARLAAFYGDRAAGRTSRFPHELGLLFGYPAEDVRGFMEGREATCSGPWRAYGDAAEARRRFEAVERCELSCRSRFRAGECVGDIVSNPRPAPVGAEAPV